VRIGFLLAFLFVAGAGAQPPNVVIVFVDDLGYGDLEAHHTPHLDRLATEGMTFTDFYVAQPVCSASRAALLTGCYPNRIGIAGALGPGSKRGLHDEETTIAELCKSKGYATSVYGKWHLGHHQPFLPMQHGFDEYYGIPYSNDMWPLHPDYVNLPDGTANRKRGYPDLVVFEGDTVVDTQVTPDDQKRFTSDLGQRAADFIDRHHDEPFLLYLAHPMPHVPLFVSEGSQGRSGKGLYGDVVAEIDDSVGAVLTALDRHGINENTLVIFTSDNGPWLSYGDHGGTAKPLREGKGTTFEGGVRVPCIMRWPETVPAGAVCNQPMMTIDVLPTVAQIIDAPLPTRRIDGRDASALLRGTPGATAPQQTYFFYYHDNHLEAVRHGRWKLHLPHGYRTMHGRDPGTGGTPGKYDYSPTTDLELYDLQIDPGETTDVADAHPEIVAQIMVLVEAMRDDLGDKLTKHEGEGRRAPGRLPDTDS
jgi:arylsulfatase A-like enzyme